MSVIEKAAMAAWDAVCATNDERSGGYVGVSHGNPFYVDGFIDPKAIARAVLLAVRKQATELEEAGEGHRSGWNHLDEFRPHSNAGIFASMIDSILEDPK